MKIRSLFLPVLFLAAASGACRKTTPAPLRATDSARLMVLQPNPYQGPMDVFSVYMDTLLVSGGHVAYPGITTYQTVPSGVRYIFSTVANTYAINLLASLYFKPGGSYTLYNISYLLTPAAFIEDDLSPPAKGAAKVRIIQGANYNRRLDWIIHGGDTLGVGLGFRNQYSDTTSFREVPAGNYLFDLYDHDTPYAFEASLQAQLEEGKIYTVYSRLLPTIDSVQIKIGMQLIVNN